MSMSMHIHVHILHRRHTHMYMQRLQPQVYMTLHNIWYVATWIHRHAIYAIQYNNINMVHNSAYIASGEIPQTCAVSLTAKYGPSGVKKITCIHI